MQKDTLMINVKDIAAYDVTGIGSPLVDYIIDADDALLRELGLTKGSMCLIDEAQSARILARVRDFVSVKVPGGSAANTLAGVAMLGGKTAFMGSIGSDEDGKFYIAESEKSGITSYLKSHDALTGHAITFITPGGERSFATHLGAAIRLCEKDVDHDAVTNSKIFHIEGYLIEGDNQREAVFSAVESAKNSGVIVTLDAADPGVVARTGQHFDDCVKKSDIVFFNEEEAEAYTGLSGAEAAIKIAKDIPVAVVKLGSKGSVVASGSQLISIKGFPAKLVNTNGAGDNYAAGFIYGLTHGMNLEKCGTLGSFIASKVVEEQGARLTAKPNISLV
jgi:sugar/nucleoside kinase (ribokinase family)